MNLFCFTGQETPSSGSGCTSAQVWKWCWRPTKDYYWTCYSGILLVWIRCSHEYSTTRFACSCVSGTIDRAALLAAAVWCEREVDEQLSVAVTRACDTVTERGSVRRLTSSHLYCWCPLCGVNVVYIAAMQSLSVDKSAWRMPGWLNGCLAEWKTGWIDDWLNERQTEWMTGWMKDWLAVWLNNWLFGWLSSWLTGWLVGCSLADWLVDRMTSCVTAWLNACPRIWLNCSLAD